MSLELTDTKRSAGTRLRQVLCSGASVLCFRRLPFLPHTINHQPSTINQLTFACAVLCSLALTAQGQVASGGAQVAAAPAPAVSSTGVTSTAAASAGPKIEFDSTTYNFEKVKQGQVVKHSFIFTNTGNATLEILDVKTGCGCTTAGQWDKSVEPGKTGALPLQFDSTGFSGTVSKTATITCNDAAKSNVVLALAGLVWRPIDFNPGMAMFQMEAEDQTNQTKVIRLISNLDEPVTISNAVCANPSFKAELKEVKPGKEYELEVTAIPPFTNTAYAGITLKTSSLEAPLLTLTAYVTVQQQVMLLPQQLMLAAGPFTNSVKSSVTIVGRGKEPLHVSEPVLAIPGVQLDLKETQPGRVFIISATFPAGFKLDMGQHPELTLKTDHPKFPLLKIPIFQQSPLVASVAAAAASLEHGTDKAQPVVPSKRVVPVRKSLPSVTQ